MKGGQKRYKERMKREKEKSLPWLICFLGLCFE